MIDIKLRATLPFAIGVYGGPSGPIAVGGFKPIGVPEFRQTAGSGFKGALYKDSTGKYVIAYAGTEFDSTADLAADVVRAAQNAKNRAGMLVDGSTWHPQFTDALEFAYQALKESTVQSKISESAKER